MIEASSCWIGEHDYSSFRASGCQSLSPIRTIYSIKITRIGDQVILDFVANAYLHHMIRNMAGVLMSIGSGRAPIIWAKEILHAKNRCKGGVTASPLGLYLVQVQYPEDFGLPQLEVGPWFLKMNEDF
jgi:tRNA pseudouridine38-40 synthase